MIVVCIKNIIDKYPTDKLPFTIGKVYDLKITVTTDQDDNVVDIDYKTISDSGNEVSFIDVDDKFPGEYFTPVEEHRQQQLNKLGI